MRKGVRFGECASEEPLVQWLTKHMDVCSERQAVTNDDIAAASVG